MMKQRQRKRAIHDKAYGFLLALDKRIRRMEYLRAKRGQQLLGWLRSQFSTYAEALAWFEDWVWADQPENFVTSRVACCSRRVMAGLVSDALEGFDEPTSRGYTDTRYGWGIYGLVPDYDGGPQ